VFRRVAHHVALAELNYSSADQVEEIEEAFYRLMTELKFLPNSPTLMNAGLELGQLAACFVLPIEDSIEGTFDALKSAALIHKSGGGTGFYFSRIRPKNSRVGTTGGVASGPVSFMRIFNAATEQVMQGGTRRGVNMAILRIGHPDIMEFVCSKKDGKDLNNFNISVALTIEFMEALGIIQPNNRDEALSLAEKVMSVVQESSKKASIALAEERVVFPSLGKSVFKDRPDCRYRNATTTTIAPTGTLSMIAGCSSGIDPLFGLSFTRNVMDDELTEMNPHFEMVAMERGFFGKELMDRVAKSGTLRDIEEIPTDVKEVFVTAHDMSPEWHVKMQASFQKYTDNAVSRTVNLPHDATSADVLKIYNLAYELGCKGVTIYRDGSKDRQVLSFKNGNDINGFCSGMRERPETIEGFTTKIKTGLGNLYVHVTE
jgi:ribonucleotide reductase alpha subunit